MTCTRTVAKDDPADTGCQITGRDLFLLDSIASDSSFGNAAEVPLGFAGESMFVPRPADNKTLYLKLRDDPECGDNGDGLDATIVNGIAEGERNCCQCNSCDVYTCRCGITGRASDSPDCSECNSCWHSSATVKAAATGLPLL